tara:strand:+ start:433 stop:639 length:207 start_codon:yes stop_codon:yes gene_type:complete
MLLAEITMLDISCGIKPAELITSPILGLISLAKVIALKIIDLKESIMVPEKPDKIFPIIIIIEVSKAY